MRRFLEEDDLRVERVRREQQLDRAGRASGDRPDRDVDIDIEDHSLRIRAERRHEERKDEQGFYHSDFRHGTFTR
jgi:HSP20 family protein